MIWARIRAQLMELTAARRCVLLISGSAKRALTKSCADVSCASSHVQWDVTYLAVVECAVDGQVVYVGVKDSSHLSFLDGADLALRVHNEDGNILLSAQTIDGSRTCVTTCCADDGQMFPVAS